MFLASVDQTIVATALPNIAGSAGRRGADLLGGRRLSDGDHDRGAGLWPAGRRVRAQAAAVRGDGGVHRRQRGCCAFAPTMLLLIAARGAAGGGRRRADDAVAGAGGRDRAAAGAAALPGLSGRHVHGLLDARAGGGRVADPAFRLALGVPGQPAAGRARAAAGVPAAVAAGFGRGVPVRLAGARACWPGSWCRCCWRSSGRSACRWRCCRLVLVLVAVSAGSLVAAAAAGADSRSPLIPVKVLRDPSIWRCDAMAACVGAMIVGGVTFMPIYLQVVRGADPARVGLLLLPLTAGIAIGSTDHGAADQQDRPDRDLPGDRAGGGGGGLDRAGVRWTGDPVRLAAGAVRGDRAVRPGRRCRWCR